MERALTADEIEDEDEITVVIDGDEVIVPVPEPLGDIHFVYLDGRYEHDFDVAVVLIRQRGTWEQLRGLLGGRRPEVLESSLEFGIDDEGDEGPD